MVKRRATKKEPAVRVSSTFSKAFMRVNDAAIDITSQDNGAPLALVTVGARVVYSGEDLNHAFAVFDRHGGAGYLAGIRAILGVKTSEGGTGDA
jgi:hypothetical protein